MDGRPQLALVASDVILEESNFSHGFVQSKYKSISLFKNFWVCDSLDIVEDVRTTKFHSINFQILVLDDLFQLLNLSPMGISSLLQLLFAKQHHFRTKIMHAFIQIFESEDDAESWRQCLRRQPSVSHLGQEYLYGAQLAGDLQMLMPIHRIKERSTEPLLRWNMLVDSIAAHFQAFGNRCHLVVHRNDACLHQQLINLNLQHPPLALLL